MDNATLLRKAPSIFTTEPHEGKSKEYKLIPTIDVINTIRDFGFEVTHAGQQKVRSADKVCHTKHMVRMRSKTACVTPIVGDTVPELVLWNSHGFPSAASHFDVGFYRFVCANGMVTKDAEFSGIRILHKGEDILDRVAEGVRHAQEQIDRLINNVYRWKAVELEAGEEIRLATKMLLARYGDISKSPILPHTLMTPRRNEDNSVDLWTSFNKMQEHLMRGGLNSGLRGDKRLRTTRPVRGVSETIRFNREAWSAAQTIYDEVTA